MNILLVTNIYDDKGLLRDARVLEQLLTELGHSATAVDFRAPRAALSHQYDLAIHLEVVEPQYLTCAMRNWWIPNPEWAKSHYMQWLGMFEAVLCKTEDAFRIFRPMTSYATKTGFMSRDCRLPITKQRVFFHAARGAINKGTEAVVEACKQKRFELRLVNQMPEEQYRVLQNQCWFHLQPSWYEGWGHTLHEGLSVGALVVSTRNPPMSSTPGMAYLIPPVRRDTVERADIGIVDNAGVLEAVDWCANLSDAELEEKSKVAREAYEAECAEFRCNLKRLLNG